MVNTYLHRVERVEAVLAPKDELILLLVEDGQTREDALAAYATAHGMKPADLRGPMVYLNGVDALL